MKQELTNDQNAEIRYDVAEFPTAIDATTDIKVSLEEAGIKEEDLNNRQKRVVKFLGQLKNLHCLL